MVGWLLQPCFYGFILDCKPFTVHYKQDISNIQKPFHKQGFRQYHPGQTSQKCNELEVEEFK